MYKNLNIKCVASELVVDVEKNLFNPSCRESTRKIIKIIEGLIDNLNRSDFDRLIKFFILNSEKKENYEKINNRFLDLIECVSETVVANKEDNFTSGALISIPLTFISKNEAQFTKITDAIGNKIESAFKNNNAIKRNSFVAFLPRILSSEEAHAIGFHEARKINHLLSSGDLRSAMQIVVQSRLKLDIGFPPTENLNSNNNNSKTTGILAMYVETQNENPFNIFEEIDNQSDRDEDEIRFIRRTRSKMSAIIKDVQSALKVDSLIFEDHNWDWFSQLYSSCELSRIINANTSFDRIVEKYGSGVIKNIALDPAIDLVHNEGSFRLRFYNSENKRKENYHSLMWPIISGETTDECTDAIDIFLKSINSRKITSTQRNT